MLSTPKTGALSTRRIRFRHGRRVVLDGIDLDVSSGELLCILGASGSGKTTLLRIVAGLLEPTEGEVAIDGISQRNVAPNERDIGFVFQETSALFPSLNVFDNVMFPFRAGRLPRNGGKAKLQVSEILNRLGIDNDRQKAVAQLSGGEKQRVALARALVYRPRLLLLDEPTASLDNKNKRDFIELLREYHRTQPFTCVFVTHDEREACAAGDRIAILGRNGKILQSDQPKNLRLSPATVEVAEMMRGWNLIQVQYNGGKLKLPSGISIIEAAIISCAPCCRLQEEAHYYLGFRCGAATLQSSPPEPTLELPSTLSAIEAQEYQNVLVCDSPAGTGKVLRVLCPDGYTPSIGTPINLHIPLSQLRLFPQL